MSDFIFESPKVKNDSTSNDYDLSKIDIKF